MNDSENSLLLTLADVARELGVGHTSIKRWADEGRLPCIKTAGGHRRFRRSEVLAFRDQMHCDAPGSASIIDPSDPRGWLDQIDDLASPTAWMGRLVLLRARTRDWAEACDRVARELIQEIGSRWQSGHLRCGQEHAISHALSIALGQVAYPVSEVLGAPLALLACPAGERHTLGLSLVEVVLRERGFRIWCLGADTPDEELVEAIRVQRPVVVGLSAAAGGASPEHAASAARSAADVCEATSSRLVLGGAGNWPKTHRAIRVHSLTELAAAVADLAPTPLQPRVSGPAGPREPAE